MQDIGTQQTIHGSGVTGFPYAANIGRAKLGMSGYDKHRNRCAIYPDCKELTMESDTPRCSDTCGIHRVHRPTCNISGRGSRDAETV